MADALEDHKGIVSIGGRTITDLRSADDVVGLTGVEEELAKLVERLDKASTTGGMEISAEKTQFVITSVVSTRLSKSMNRSLKQSEASSTWAQLCPTRVPRLRYSAG